ncbi:Tad domain-containing protein [Frederiksenia canicola]|uniref:Tight adherence protein G n=1 Tax=Frederiksenia canicola TaxID=123824 RepID=A0AAE7C171_9PAST|nr:Tad domain-containing protein [Frederiksenia canicola]QIM63960.1 hypothetical protein A4G17_00105 [Frederiksenia canicola]RPE95718.1 tight adherence protein G [Frederiksenia canicola]
MKKQIFKQSKLSQNLSRFIKKEEGVYSILMAGMGATLLAIIAFAVDGSGVILDQARLSDSLEQASLAVTSENNTYRKDKYQINDPTGKHDSFSQNLRNQRDKELVESYVKAYMPNIKSWTPNDISCKQNLQGANNETIQCRVSGTVVREALLPLTFSNSANSSSSDFSISTGAVAEKSKSAPPLDVMIVADFSGSMSYRLDNPNLLGYASNSKSAILKSVLYDLTDNYLFKEDDSLNRIGFTAFSFGAKVPNGLDESSIDIKTKAILRSAGIQLDKMEDNCVLPYLFETERAFIELDNGQKVEKNVVEFLTDSTPTSRRWETLSGFSPQVSVKKTIKQVESFDGSAKHYSVIFKVQRIPSGNSSYARCVGYNNQKGKNVPGAAYWFDRSKKESFKDFLREIEPEGATLVTSGLLVGTNLMSDKKHHLDPKKVGNTQRIIVILSDGKDQSMVDSSYHQAPPHRKPLEKKFRDLTEEFIEGGLCDVVRARMDGLQSTDYRTYESKLAFIAFGYDPDERNDKAWRKCVGDKNYFIAKTEEDLLDSFKKAFTTEEVGHSLNP